MSVATTERGSSAGNPIILGLILLAATAFGIGVTGYGVLALGAFMGLLGFLAFMRWPVLGLYVTTALLLLQGSAGVISLVNEESPMAITVAQLAGAGAMAAWVAHMLMTRVPFHISRPALFLAVFCVWALMGTLLSLDAREMLPHWARMIFRFGLLLLAINTLTDAKSVKTYISLILASAVIMSALSVVQYVRSTQQISGMQWASAKGTDAAYVDPDSLDGQAAVRVAGRAGHSNWLALILLVVLPMNVYWYFQAKTFLRKSLVLLLVLLEIGVLVLTFTRTGLIVGGLVVLLLIARGMLKISPLKISFGLLAIIVAFSMLPNAYRERVLSPKQYTQSKSVSARITLQEAAARYAIQHPFFGLGVGGFGLEFVREGSETAAQMRYVVQAGTWPAIFIGTHNMYLQVLADTGIAGFILYAFFFVIMMRGLFRMHAQYKKNDDDTGMIITGSLIVSLITFALCAIFLHALHQPIWWIIAGLAIAIPLHNIDFRPEAATKASAQA